MSSVILPSGPYITCTIDSISFWFLYRYAKLVNLAHKLLSEPDSLEPCKSLNTMTLIKKKEMRDTITWLTIWWSDNLNNKFENYHAGLGISNFLLWITILCTVNSRSRSKIHLSRLILIQHDTVILRGEVFILLSYNFHIPCQS